MRGVALVVTSAMACVTVAHGCGPSASDRLVGWPDAQTQPSQPAETQVSVEVDTAPEASEAADTGAGDVDPLANVPCKALSELACGYFGPHTDECALARTERPDDTDAATRAACAALVERYTTTEETARLNPCRRYSRLVCNVEGVDTPTCQTSRRNLPLLRRQEEKRACLGDMLMFEARDLRR